MKFAIVSDSHLGPSPYYANQNCIMSTYADELLHRVAMEVQNEGDVSFIVHLGDFIQESLLSPNAEEDKANLRRCAELLSRGGVDLYQVAGNHDFPTFSEQDLCAQWGLDRLYYSFDREGFHFIVLYSDTNADETISLSQEQNEWLNRDLAEATYPTIVFSHHSLGDINLASHKWYKHHPEKCLIDKRAEVRSMLEASGKVKAVFNGHVHYNSFCSHGGIPYFTLQSVVENFCDRDIPSACFGIVEISEHSISVDIRGNQPVSYFLEFFR